MSVSAVQEILNAESEARRIKDAALADAKNTVAAAHAEGEKLLADAEKAASEAAAKKLQETEAAIKKSDAEHEKEIAAKVSALKASAKEKIPGAIKFITEHI